MDAGEHRDFFSISTGDFFDEVKPQFINDFCLSHSRARNRLFDNETPFIFGGFCISVCLSGGCVLKIGGRNRNVSSGSLLILSPDQLISPVSATADFEAKSIIVSQDMILEFPSPVDINIINMALRNPVVDLPERKLEDVLEYYDFLEKRYSETPSAYRVEIAKTLLYALLLELCDIFRSVSEDEAEIRKPRQEKLTDDFFVLLTRHFRTEHHVGFYADRLNRTPKYLSGAVKRITGKSVSDWISSTLISEIKMLLNVTDKTVLEISEELNFSSPSVFVQYFRRNTGITPLQYRKRR